MVFSLLIYEEEESMVLSGILIISNPDWSIENLFIVNVFSSYSQVLLNFFGKEDNDFPSRGCGWSKYTILQPNIAVRSTNSIVLVINLIFSLLIVLNIQLPLYLTTPLLQLRLLDLKIQKPLPELPIHCKKKPRINFV